MKGEPAVDRDNLVLLRDLFGYDSLLTDRQVIICVFQEYVSMKKEIELSKQMSAEAYAEVDAGKWGQ